MITKKDRLFGENFRNGMVSRKNPRRRLVLYEQKKGKRNIEKMEMHVGSKKTEGNKQLKSK